MSENDFGQYHCQGLDRARLHDEQVLRAMSRVPRHRFVPPDMRHLAYEDRALPIGFGQTISQPYIVGVMTQEARVAAGSKVLEIGTGSGYQAAVISELGAQVFSVEIVGELIEKARALLDSLSYDSVSIIKGDGWRGWEDESPFDAILVTAASPRLPRGLISQLSEGGRMVIPLEQDHTFGEELLVIEKHGDKLESSEIGAVRFVPLVGQAREDTGEFEH